MILRWLKLVYKLTLPEPDRYWFSCRFFSHATFVVLPYSRKTHHVQTFDNFIQKKWQLPFRMADGPDSLMWGC